MITRTPRVFFQQHYLSAGAYYRLTLPYITLLDRGYPVFLGVSNSELMNGDIFIYRNLDNSSIIPEIKKFQQSGVKVIIDYDDNCFKLDPRNPTYHGTQQVLDQIKEVMSAADALTVTVKELIEPFSRYNDHIFVLPNCVDEKTLEYARVYRDRLTIGWQGGDSHHEDLNLIKSVINNMMRKYSFDFVLAGYKPSGVFKECIFRPWVPFSEDFEYKKLFNDFDIGICPLKRNPFNDCKSDLKFLEYASLGIPTVASKMVTYETIRHGETGYLARNLSDWEKYLTELIEDEDKRRKIGQAAKEYVAAERTIQKNIHLWENLYVNL